MPAPKHPLEIPDFLGKDARIESVGNLIQRGQDQIQMLTNERIAALDQPGDPIPARLLPPPPPDPLPTYEQRIAEIQKGMDELWAGHAEIHEELIADAVDRRKRLAEQIAQRHREVR